MIRTGITSVYETYVCTAFGLRVHEAVEVWRVCCFGGFSSMMDHSRDLFLLFLGMS